MARANAPPNHFLAQATDNFYPEMDKNVGSGPVWRSQVISRKTKPRIFNKNVKSVLSHGSETRRTTEAASRKIHTFVNKCLGTILQIYLPRYHLTPRPMAKNTTKSEMELQIKRKRCVNWVTFCANQIPAPPSRI